MIESSGYGNRSFDLGFVRSGKGLLHFMDKEEVVLFLESIGAENIDASPGSDWVKVSCPLAPWFHESGRDEHPSFGVKAGPSPTYHCFACGCKGPLPRLLHNLHWLTGKRFEEASALLSADVSDIADDDVRGRKRKIVEDKFGFIKRRAVLRNIPVPDEVLKKYPLLVDVDCRNGNRVKGYLVEERGIPLQSIAMYGIRCFRDERYGKVGYVFPVMSRDGKRTLDLWARIVDGRSFFRLNATITGSKENYSAPNVWMGWQFYDPEKPVILVEGVIDLLKLKALGVSNVLGCGGGPSREQLATLHSRVTYFGFDADAAGRGFTKRALELVDSPSRFLLDWSKAIVKDRNTGEMRPAKDPGDLENKAQFKKVFDARIKVAPRELSGKRL